MTIDTAEIARTTIWSKPDLDEALTALTDEGIEWMLGYVIALAEIHNLALAGATEWVVKVHREVMNQEAP